MATTWNISAMTIARTTDDSVPLRSDAYIEEASAAFSVGDPLQPDSSTQNELEIYDDSAGKIIGLALVAATTVADSPVYIEEIRGNCIMEANAVQPSSATAIAQTDIGKKYGVKEHTDGNWIIDMADTTSTRAIITGLAGMAVHGDINPRVEFQWINEHLYFEFED